MSETDKLTQEQQSHDAEIRRIGTELSLEWPTTVEEIVKKLRAVRADERRKVIEECCKTLCDDCARGNVPKWYGGILGHNESGLSCGAALIRRHFKLPEVTK